MKILILSQYPWNKENSFGNTYSSYFSQIKDVEIAHIFLMSGKPDYEPVVKRYYQIPEKSIISSLFKRSNNYSVGKEVFVTETESKSNIVERGKTNWYQRILSAGKRKHWRWMFWLRELAWKYGNINYDGMMSFIKDFNPDVFFLPYSHIFYTNRIALYIKDRLDIPMVIEMAMDHYSMNRVSYDPIFWIDRLAKRRMIRKLVNRAVFMYVISKKMQDEYRDMLNIECKVLYKIPDNTRQISTYSQTNNPVRFLFTGNIYANRWKSLAMLARELQHQKYGRLDIYTATPISSKMNKALNVPPFSFLHNPVSQNEVVELQNEADVLVHTEAFDKKNRSLVRCAISTKIMDYLSVGRCILAIGPSDISSIEYLADNDVAIIACDKKALSGVVLRMKNDPNVILEYANKGVYFSYKHLNAVALRQRLYDDLQEAINNYISSK